jgi:hypothetical protein
MKLRTINTMVIVGCFVFLLNSCRQTFNTIIEIDVPHTPMLSVFSRTSNLSDTTYATIRATRGINDTGFCPLVLNAQVQLLENGVEVSQLTLNAESNYAHPFNGFVGGRTYSLKANALGYEQATTVEIMPKPLANLTYTVKRNMRKMNLEQSGTQWYDEVTFTFDDEGSTEDYYGINVTEYVEQFQETNNFFWGGDLKYSLDEDVDVQNSEDPTSAQGVYYGKMYMKDVNFNGKKKEVVIYVPNHSFEPKLDPTRFFVLVERMTKNSYLYEKSRELYINNDGNPFSEPVLVHSNITNGIGIFTLKHRTIDSLIN